VPENYICGIVAGLFKHCRACLPLIVLAPLSGLPAQDEAYLPLVGPPPLRFEEKLASAAQISWTPPPIVVETNPPPEISAIPSHNIEAAAPASASTNAPAPSPPENLSTNSTSETHSANDLLVVTPEMLVDYFKPSNVTTNSTDVQVPASVNFTPPASALIPSSQAIYQSQ